MLTLLVITPAMQFQQDYSQIWNNFRKGDEASFRLIYDGFYTSLLNYGLRFTPNVEIAEDAIQDLYIKLWTNRKNINQTAGVKNYLYKAFRRTLIRKLEQQAVVATGLEEESPVFDFQLSHEHVLIRQEQLQQTRAVLQQALEAMTSRQREMIYLRFYEDLSYDQIAEMMEITTKGAYKLVYRALDKLRENLGGISLSLALWLLKNTVLN